MTVLQTGLTLGVACSWSYWLLAVIAAARFGRLRRPQQDFQPSVSILKPLCGLDPELRENLTSFMRQDFATYEVVFVARDPLDPGLAVAREVAERHPSVSTAVLAESPDLGRNRKTSNLAHAMTVAQHDLIVVADSDIRVGPDYLRRVTAPFADERVGVLTCLYKAIRPSGLAARLEALAIGSDFTPSVLVAWMLRGTSFGFGSTLVVRRPALEAIGGLTAVADEIADDYRLAERVRAAGRLQPMSEYVVDCVMGTVSWRTSWQRRVRWARTVRSLQPLGYIGMALTHGTIMALLCVPAFRDTRGWVLLALTLVLRLTTAIATARLGARDEAATRNALLLPLSDLVGFAVWLAGLVGGRVVWRGNRVDLAPN